MEDNYMYQYTWYQWLFIFYLYCFLGWIFESSYVSLKERQSCKPGFLQAASAPSVWYGSCDDAVGIPPSERASPFGLSGWHDRFYCS